MISGIRCTSVSHKKGLTSDVKDFLCMQSMLDVGVNGGVFIYSYEGPWFWL